MLWFASRNGVVSLSPEKVVRTAFKPSIHLTSFSADDKTYMIRPEIAVPPRTRRLEIQYTAVDLSSPQLLRFRYRLIGLENVWHDAGSTRVATYNNLKPGPYRLEVTASSGNDVWSDPQSILTVNLPPAWNQTRLFYGFLILTAVAIGLIVSKFERERRAAALRMAFNSRIAERTRLARQLHDTLLQTLQGSNLIADQAYDTVKDVAEAKRIFGLLTSWLTKADGEGRAVLDALREEPSERSLEDTIQEHVDEMPLCFGITAINVNGKSRSIYPEIKAEISQICLEAIRNACIHSQSSTIKVDITFSKELIVEIQDDGIGFNAEVQSPKKAGHYGLAGMRERAAEIRAQLSIVSTPTSGTLVKLVVPGKLVYELSRSAEWFRSIFPLTKKLSS